MDEPYRERDVTADGHGAGVARRNVADPVVMVLIGVVGLVTKRNWGGGFGELVWSYWGNITASFSVFFVVGLVPHFRKLGRLATAVIALIVVELFELTDGFGVMSNVYDTMDLGANVVGIGLAFLADTLVSRVRVRISDKG
jgi:hypothetical protein